METSKTIDMALARLDIARTPHPLADGPEFQVHLAVEQEAPSFGLPDCHRSMPAYGVLYQQVFHAEPSLVNGIRLRPFLARKVPHMLAAGLEPDALDGFLEAVLRCFEERGELEDLALIETCRAYGFTEEATTAGCAALQAGCDRLNEPLQGLLIPVQPDVGQGTLTRVGDHRADSRLGALTRKEGGDEPSCNDRLEEE